MIAREEPVRLEDRFDILRRIIQGYRDQIREMETEVVQLFAQDELDAISDTIREKQRVERLIEKLEQFVSHWEARVREQEAERLVAHTSQQENLNVPGNLRYI